MFYPYVNKKATSFSYDERLERFIVSLSWRTLEIGYEDFEKEKLDTLPYVKAAEETWRNFLLGKAELGSYENHLLFLDYLEESSENQMLNWYNMRAIDSCLIGNSRAVHSYTKFPQFIFVTSIYPMKLDGWEGTSVSRNGTIGSPQTIEDDWFGEFLQNRSDMVMSIDPFEIYPRRKEAFLKSIVNNPERFLTSESFEVLVKVKDAKRKAKMNNMPESIRELVDIIVQSHRQS